MSKMTDSRIAWVQKFETGKIWYNKLVSYETKRTYLRNLRRYCKAVGKNPDELIAMKMEGLKNIGTPKEFQAENLLEDFFANCTLTDSAKIALKTAVLSFYKHNRRELASNVASNIMHPEYKQRCPDMQDILDLDSAMQTERDKSILWFLASTAFRIGTVVELKWNDLEPTGDSDVPYQMIVDSDRLKGSGRGRYRGLRQVAFLHSLVAEKLDKYKNEIERRGYEIKDDSPIFIAYRKKQEITALKTGSIEAKFAKASLVAWGDLEKKRFSPHDFRDFIQSKLESAGINRNIIAPLLAHRVKGTDFHYSKHEVDELREKFKGALSYLLPETVAKVKTEHDMKFRQQEAKIKWQEDRIKTLEDRLSANGLSIKKMIIDFTELKEYVEEEKKRKAEEERMKPHAVDFH